MSAVLSALVLARAAACTEPELAWRLWVGETLRYRVTREQRFEAHAKWIDRGGSVTTVEDFSVKVESVGKDGNAVLVATLDAIRGKHADDDDPDVEEVDSKAKDQEMAFFFEEHLANVGKSRRIGLSPVGRATLLDEPVADDPTSWTWMFPEGAHLATTASASRRVTEQRFPATFALEHGMATWPVAATSEPARAGAARRNGVDCVRLELAPRFALIEDADLRELAEKKALAAEPTAGKGSMLFAAAEGMLVRFELSGKNKVRVTLPDLELDELDLSIENALTVELVERNAPETK